MADEFQQGEIIVVMARRELRKLNGSLENPPEMFVFLYDRKSDSQAFWPIRWDVAEALAPEKFQRVSDDVQAVRRMFPPNRLADFKPGDPVERRIGQVFFQLPKVNHG